MLTTGMAEGSALTATWVMNHLAWLQAQDSINSGNSKLLMIFIGIAAFALFVQAAAVVAVALGAMKAQKVIMGHVEEIKAKVMPLVEKSHNLVTDLTPQIKDITAKVQTITGHVEEIAGVVKDKVNEFSPSVTAAHETFVQANDTARDANAKAHAQVARVNDMVTSLLDSTAAFGKAFAHGITQPGREIAGFVSGAKATIEQLVHKQSGFGSVLGKVTGLFGGKKQKPVYRSPVLPYPPVQRGPGNRDAGF